MDYDAIGLLIEARRDCVQPNMARKLSHAIDYLRDREGYRRARPKQGPSLRRSVLCSSPRGRRFMSPKGAL